MTTEPTASFYERVGGEPTFRVLVDRFYEGVAGDPPLRALYPEEDLGPAADRLRLFLEQYWGGPHRSHCAASPGSQINRSDGWLHHMLAAVDTLALPEPEDAELRAYLMRAAQFMINQFE